MYTQEQVYWKVQKAYNHLLEYGTRTNREDKDLIETKKILNDILINFGGIK